jgi:hypothetical protein
MSTPLQPRGTLRSRFVPQAHADIFRRIGAGARNCDLGDEGLYLAEELVAADRWLGESDAAEAPGGNGLVENRRALMSGTASRRPRNSVVIPTQPHRVRDSTRADVPPRDRGVADSVRPESGTARPRNPPALRNRREAFRGTRTDPARSRITRRRGNPSRVPAAGSTPGMPLGHGARPAQGRISTSSPRAGVEVLTGSFRASTPADQEERERTVTEPSGSAVMTIARRDGLRAGSCAGGLRLR